MFNILKIDLGLPRRTARAAGVLVAAALFSLAGCRTFNTYETQSRRPTQSIVIDGKTDDWRGDLFVVDNERASIGFLNDQDYLYIALLAEDPYQRFLILGQGLTVWFDPKGGKEKAFGIRFPLGSPPGQVKMPRMGDETEGAGLDAIPAEALAECEIVRSEKEPPRKLKIADIKGLEIKVTPSAGLLVYELKIPLVQSADHPLAVGAPAGKTVGIGFETSKFDPSKMPKDGREGTPEGSRRPPMGGTGGRGGMGGMGGMGRGMGLGQDLKIWAQVQLSPGQSAAPAALLSISKRP